MKTKNLIFGGVFLLGGYWVIRNFLNKKVEAEKPVIDTGFKCPLNELSEKEQKEFEAERDRFIKNDPIFGALRYAEYKVRTTPYWNPSVDCTPEEIANWNKRFDKGIKEMGEKASRGLMPPLLTPFAQKTIENRFGKGIDPNKNYNRWCGTEICWNWNEKQKKWIKE
jgi:hypothetical protein